MSANYLVELGDKSYEFNPGRDITLAEWEYMENAFGIEYGGWFTFRDRLTKIGHVNAVRSLVWLVQRHFEGSHETDPRRVELPAGFSMGQFLEDIRDKDVLDALEEAKKDKEKDAAGPTGSSRRRTSTPAGAEPSATSEPS